MIISDNTERASLKLTHCSCRKKAHETENLSAKEGWNTKQNLHTSWSFLLPIVKPAIRRSLPFFFAAGSILLQFKVHLLGKPRYTLTERLLANLTDLRFLPSLAHKNGLETSKVFDFAAWPFSPVPGRVWVTLAHTIVTAPNVWKIIKEYPRNFCSGGC